MELATVGAGPDRRAARLHRPAGAPAHGRAPTSSSCPRSTSPAGSPRCGRSATARRPIVRNVGGLRGHGGGRRDRLLVRGLHPGGVRGGRRSARSTATREPARWQTMMRQGMARDFSWERSVATYLDVYRRALARSGPAGDGGPMDFVFTLHSHLPYVLNHGRWPHGSDWICEAALDTYLPLLEALQRLGAEDDAGAGDDRVHAGARQPAREPRRSCRRWRRSSTSGSPPAPKRRPRWPRPARPRLLPLVEFWRERLLRLRRPVPRRRRRSGRRLPRARGRGTPGDHRLGRDARLPPAARARREHPAPARGRHRGAPPPLRPRAGGLLAPGMRLPAARARGRRGPPRPEAACGVASRSTWPTPGSATSSWMRTSPPPAGRSASPAIPPRWIPRCTARPAPREPSPRSARRTRPIASPTPAASGDVSAYVRDPRASMQVWSRFEGYPGDGVYLEFHKMRWPGGLKLWRVSGPERGSRRQGAVRPRAGARSRPRPRGALRRAPGRHRRRRGPAPGRGHRRAVRYRAVRPLVVRGPRFPRRRVPRARAGPAACGPATASQHLTRHPSRTAIRMPAGSWGANGDFTHVAERADRLDLGAAVAARGAVLGRRARRRSPRRGHAASSWRRPRASCCWRSPPTGSSSSPRAPRPTTASGGSGSTAATPRSWSPRSADGTPDALERARRRAGVLAERDALFPDVLPAVAAALGGSRSLALG